MPRAKKTETELKIIRGHRDWKTRLLVSLFPRQFNSFANSHLSRAYELTEIGSKPLHSLAHYIGADCGLPGHGAPVPWYLKGPGGWPIEFRENQGQFSRGIRILFQNVRKVTG